ASVTYCAWDQTSGTQGTKRSEERRVGKECRTRASANEYIKNSSVKDAPLLSGGNNFTTISDGQSTNGGDLVLTLLGGPVKVGDFDSGGVPGIAVTGLVSSTGAWQYSLDGGGTWNAVGAVAGNSGL